MCWFPAQNEAEFEFSPQFSPSTGYKIDLLNCISTILGSLESSWREQRQDTRLHQLTATNQAREHSKVISKPNMRANFPIKAIPLSSVAECSNLFEAIQTSANYVITMCWVGQRAHEEGFTPKMAKRSIKILNLTRQEHDARYLWIPTS